jgi:hypothetical protein
MLPFQKLMPRNSANGSKYGMVTNTWNKKNHFPTGPLKGKNAFDPWCSKWNWYIQIICPSPPFFNYIFNIQIWLKMTFSTIIYFFNCNLSFQLLTTIDKKYKLKMKLQSKVKTMCEHHNYSHFWPFRLEMIPPL